MFTSSLLTVITKEIPLDHLVPDVKQPRKELGVDKDDDANRLLVSLAEIGQLSPITVVKVSDNKYKIINGHRRYECAKKLGWKRVRCEIHPEYDEGELKRVRFNIQTNERPWKPLERSRELQQIKQEKKLSNKELAEYIHYPESLISAALTLQKRREKFQSLMDEFELSEAHQTEFMKLQPKIRPIREFSEYDIYRNIFTRVKHRIIATAKDFRKLSSVFIRAHANEEEIYLFLKDPDMQVEPLYSKTERSGFIRDAERFVEEVKAVLKEKNTPPQQLDAIRAAYNFLHESLAQLNIRSSGSDHDTGKQ